MLIYGRKVVILPFRKEAGGTLSSSSAAPMAADAQAATSSGKVMATYMLDLQAVIQTNKVDNIIDIQFLHGYRYFTKHCEIIKLAGIGSFGDIPARSGSPS